MRGRKRPRNESLAELLEADEAIVVELNGVVTGFTRWSGAGGIAGVVVALTVPRLSNLSFLPGMVAIVVVLALVFLFVYYVVGRPLARRHDPPLTSPYLAVVLTDRRVLLFDRALGAAAPVLIESSDIREVSTIRCGKAGPLVPQRLGFVIRGAARREFEFPRSEPVKRFVDHFSG